jgi:peroxiredoxin
VHCVEQLNAIKPLVDAFTDAGISIVTIGTDTASQVKESVGRGGDFPFPILCDPEHEVFKTYRVWDDFESTPLHGTFLLDGDGLIRWQDISHEPFVKIQFLLEECTRLLALPPR